MRSLTKKAVEIIAVVVFAALAVVTLDMPALAGTDEVAVVTIGKAGAVHFNAPVRAGTTLLKPGMYQVQHTVQGGEHFVTFKEMLMPAGYRHGNTPVSRETSATVKCKIEPADKAGSTKVTLRTNAAGEKEVNEIQVAGETFKHVF